MNPPPNGWPSLGGGGHPIHPIHARPAPLGASVQPAPVAAPLPGAYGVPQAPPQAGRSETDVQWIVGWLRDLLVIAMAITNLLHASGGH